MDKRRVKIVVVAAWILMGLWFAQSGWWRQEWVQSVLDRVPHAAAALIFVVLYVVGTSLVWIGPKDVLKIVGALVFGAFQSSVLVFVAELINAAVLFHAAQWLGEDQVAGRLGRERFQRLRFWIQTKGMTAVFLMRMFIVPFRFLDLAAGVLGLSWRRYLLIVVLGSPLRIVLVQILLSWGLDTAADPSRMAVMLQRHPLVLWGGLLYVSGGLVAFRYLSRRFSPEDEGGPPSSC